MTSDEIYATQYNQIYSVSTGAISWASGNPAQITGLSGMAELSGAVAGPNVIFTSGIDLLAQSY